MSTHQSLFIASPRCPLRPSDRRRSVFHSAWATLVPGSFLVCWIACGTGCRPPQEQETSQQATADELATAEEHGTSLSPNQPTPPAAPPGEPTSPEHAGGGEGNLAARPDEEASDLENTSESVAAAALSTAQCIEQGRVAVADLTAQFPEAPDALELRARFEYDFGNREQAATIWQQILDDNPGYLYALTGLAKYAAAQGELEKAIDYYRQAASSGQASVADLVQFGKALCEAGKWDEATKNLEQAIELAPDFVPAYQELGALGLQSRDYVAARDAFLESIERAPEDPAGHIGLATAAIRLGDRDLAHKHQAIHRRLRSEQRAALSEQRKAYDDLQAVGSDIAGLMVNVSKVYIAHQRPEAANALLQAAAQLSDNHVEARSLISQLYEQAGDLRSAADWQRQVVERLPHDFDQTMRAALLFGASGQIDAAAACVKAYTNVQPQDPRGWLALAQFYVDVKLDLEQAIELARRGAELSQTADDWVFLAALLDWSGQGNAAEQAVSQAAQLAPEQVDHQQELYESLRQQFLARVP